MSCPWKSGKPIRSGEHVLIILGACCVPDHFHARFSALSRTCVYRVATGCCHPSELPVFERHLCWATPKGHRNLSAMQEATGDLLGTRDFSTFPSASAEEHLKNPVETLTRAEVRPAPSFLVHHSKSSDLKFWELEFRSRPFLYKQAPTRSN
ncbi:tRNA pseudouridine synthase-like 1 [Hemicordylus capensis]|uniref:tRNA pseudouridine synthase-like 1 n=1 Tax=Hemicordylus capensis TaxID=884348 RepID=UPI002303136D|nr:tRNA pseudouridine synthase-like 1 [Hemicordylus capensis]